MSAPIPFEELRISTDPDWYVVDLKTVEDCDVAIVHLTRDIAHIDSQVLEEAAEEAVTGVATDQEWLTKAKSARAIKVVIKSVVQRRQGEISRANKAAVAAGHDRRMLKILKASVPEAFEAAASQVGDL